MDFTYEELARLNVMIGIALMTGKVEFDQISESIHKKVSSELSIQMRQTEDGELEGQEKRI